MSGIIRLFLTFIILTIFRHSGVTCTKSVRSLSYRLPTCLYPDYYQLFIITNLGDLNEDYTFTGRVTIKMKCLQDTNKIILHSKNLEVVTSEVCVWAGKPFTCTVGDSCGSDYPNQLNIIQIQDQCFVTEYDFYIITLAQYLRAGYYYYVNIPYKGQLTTDLAGYYRSSYKDENGNTRWLAATQFESTDARRALPCFDEPIFKARFQVNLGHPQTRSSISNMPIRATYALTEINSWVWDEFEVTPPMSVYLLAFLVFDCSFVQAKKCGIVSVYSRSGARDQVDYVCGIAPRILEYFENYFGLKYVLPELQLVAVPDFNSAGMENWGLITFRETALLYDPRVSTRSSQFYVASVVAHEIAHQWFGNLVTMKWWTDLWLNEGFATYISGFGVYHVTREVNFLDEEVMDNALSVFSFDSSITSHPISVPIGNPSEIAQIFDTISYKKGSFVLRMLHSLLGEDCFRRGLSRYLIKYAYSNAGQDDLWQSLTEEAHICGALSPSITIKEIMDTWTLQTGYPVITFRRDYQKRMGVITQERFLICPENLQRCEKFNSLWYVPLSITYTCESDFCTTVPSSWLSTQWDNMVVNVPENQWVLFNIRLSAIYRVNYDYHNWNLLTNALLENPEKIGILNRVQLIDDAFNLAKGRRVTYHVALNIIQYLRNENEYFPWKAALRNVAFVEKILRFHPAYEYLRGLLTSLIGIIYEKISPIIYADTQENLYKIKLQELIMNWACKYEIGDCKNKAMSWFYAWMCCSAKDQNPIPKNLRSQVYCAAIRAGGEREWNFLWMKYLSSNVGDEKNLILMSLTCTRDIRLLYRFISWSLREGYGIRKQDSPLVFAGIAKNEVGFFVAKNFLFNKLNDIYEFYGPNSTRIGNYIVAVGSQIIFPSDLKEFRCIVEKNKDRLFQSQLAVDQALYNAAINLWLSKAVGCEILSYFTPVSCETSDLENNTMLMDPSEFSRKFTNMVIKS